MRKAIVLRGVSALALAATAWFAASATTVLAASAPDYGAVDAYVTSQMQDAHIPGAALGIVHGDEVVHVKGFGQADATGRPVTAQTPFFIGSLSKSFTALAVMQLVDAGEVGLDTPVQAYLPGFRVADGDASRRITVRELLNQTSGIPTSAGIDPLSGPVTSLESQVAALQLVTLTASPGVRFQYSNSNYEVLGRLVEVVSGETFAGYVSNHIFAPLQMGHSHVDVAGAKADGLASAFPLWFGLPQAHAPGAGFRADTVPAGYLMSSVDDMSHYVEAQLNDGAYAGSAVVSAAGLATLQAPAIVAGLSAQGGAYAMGWFVGPQGALKQTIWHNGSAGGMHSVVVMLPAEKWGVVLLTNSESVLYEFVNRVQVIADNVAAMLAGQPMGGSLAGLYLAFDAVAVLMVALTVRQLARLIRRGPRQRSGRLARTRDVIFNWVVPIWREFWVPVGIVIGFPLLVGAPWIGNLATVDLGQWLLLMALLLFATGMTRVVLALRRRHHLPLR